MGSLFQRVQFWTLRCVLGAASAATESTLFSAVSRHVNRRTARYMLCFLIFSPGLFQAAPGKPFP